MGHLVCLIVAFLCAGCMPLMSTALGMADVHIDPQTRHFVDSHGRVRIFHGVNAVYKVAPYHPETQSFDPQLSLSAQDITNLYDWGFNVVRLGVMWPGVEPQQQQYNQSYLSVMKTLTDSMGSKGIYTIVDCHQDLWSRKYCGEGAPDWAVLPERDLLPFPFPALFHTLPLDSNGYPQVEACLKYEFSRFYFAEATGAAFQGLYDNYKNTQDSFAGFWDQVSQTFSGSPTVLGYELINEPWPGDIYRYPALGLEAGRADKMNLQPLYDRLSEAIRKNDDQHIIFYEAALSDLLHLSLGFEHVPGGAEYNNRSVLSYHVYCAPIEGHTGSPRNVLECDGMDTFYIDEYINHYKQIGGGGMMTEWGDLDAAAGSKGQRNINYVCAEADRGLQSWAWWQFKGYQDLTTAGLASIESFYSDNGTLQVDKVKALSRTYAYAIAGMPSVMSFDPATSQFDLEYSPMAGADMPTEIYLNTQWYYASGFNVTIVPASAASWTKMDANHLAVKHIQSPPSSIHITIMKI